MEKVKYHTERGPWGIVVAGCPSEKKGKRGKVETPSWSDET